MIEKTVKYQIGEAYAQGWNEAAEYFQETLEKVEKWQSRPETALTYAIQQYVKDILDELTRGIAGEK